MLGALALTTISTTLSAVGKPSEKRTPRATQRVRHFGVAASINSNTGKRHEHKREIARRLRQKAAK